MPENNRPTCPVCQIGRTQSKLITYSQVYNRTLVSVPNTPAWECDFCHAIESDSQAINRIEVLIGQAGPPPNRQRQRPTGHRSKPAVAAPRS